VVVDQQRQPRLADGPAFRTDLGLERAVVHLHVPEDPGGKLPGLLELVAGVGDLAAPPLPIQQRLELLMQLPPLRFRQYTAHRNSSLQGVVGPPENQVRNTLLYLFSPNAQEHFGRTHSLQPAHGKPMIVFERTVPLVSSAVCRAKARAAGFYSLLWVIPMLVVGTPLAADTRPRPNVVVILADDLGYSDLGCYGGEIQTPNIDALAAGGVRFTQLYNSARCCPSRASLMTGLYPSQAGIGDFTTNQPSKTRGPGYLGRLNSSCVTIAEVLRAAGYRCYYVGKWHMHSETGPIKRGFDEFYGYTRGHSHDQYDAEYYIRLPDGREKEIDPPADAYYATDVFNEYALQFIRQGQKSGRPWFLFLGHSSPHFPVQAPAERADKYEETYLRGWDVLREERFARMQELGLIDGERWKLTPRSIVPVDRDDIANGFSGKENPAWDSLDEDRKRDLARRMAVFAAMVECVDKGVGQIVDHLRETGDLDNTLILFLSDNGACYEWGPFGFDGASRRGTTTLHTGDDLRKIGGPGTHHSYGSAWANLGNTPLRLYKHFTHEGGISTPFIAHWPKGIGSLDRWIRDPAHVMDIMPTILDATGASYPTTYDGNAITPWEGTSLLPAMRGDRLPERSIGFDHQAAHALRQGGWKLVWSKRMPYEIRWELYHLAEDRCETNDLARVHPERVEKMAAEWEKWARRVDVIYEAGDAPRKPASTCPTRSSSTRSNGTVCCPST
jgi:arylsulfatase